MCLSSTVSRCALPNLDTVTQVSKGLESLETYISKGLESLETFGQTRQSVIPQGMADCLPGRCQHSSALCDTWTAGVGACSRRMALLSGHRSLMRRIRHLWPLRTEQISHTRNVAAAPRVQSIAGVATPPQHPGLILAPLRLSSGRESSTRTLLRRFPALRSGSRALTSTSRCAPSLPQPASPSPQQCTPPPSKEGSTTQARHSVSCGCRGCAVNLLCYQAVASTLSTRSQSPPVSADSHLCSRHVCHVTSCKLCTDTRDRPEQYEPNSNHTVRSFDAGLHAWPVRPLTPEPSDKAGWRAGQRQSTIATINPSEQPG